MRTADHPQVAINTANHFAHYAVRQTRLRSRRAPIAIALTLALANPVNAQDAPYPERLTMRPLALPLGMYEITAPSTLTTSDAFETDPIDTQLGVRSRLGALEARAAVTVHTRYSRADMRPVFVQSALVGGDYVISPLFTAGAELRILHPAGGDLEQGFDLRGGVAAKHVVSPLFALVGRVGPAFRSRETRGQTSASIAAGAAGDGMLQVSPHERISFEATLRASMNLAGDLYADTVIGDVSVGATIVVLNELDITLQGTLVILPWASDERMLAAGVAYRL